MYLHHILNREEKELIRRVYDTQKVNPTKGDFVCIIKKDLELIGKDDDSVKCMSKRELKGLINDSFNNKVLEEMKERQVKHKKVKNIEYDKLEIQPYMKDRCMSNSMVRTLVAMRSSMVRGVGGNFVSSSVRTQCPLQCRDTAEDTQCHLLECPVTLSKLTVAEEKDRDLVSYNDIFGDLQQQRRAASTIQRLLELREEELEERTRTSLPVGTFTGPDLCTIIDHGNI